MLIDFCVVIQGQHVSGNAEVHVLTVILLRQRGGRLLVTAGDTNHNRTTPAGTWQLPNKHKEFASVHRLDDYRS